MHGNDSRRPGRTAALAALAAVLVWGCSSSGGGTFGGADMADGQGDLPEVALDAEASPDVADASAEVEEATPEVLEVAETTETIDEIAETEAEATAVEVPLDGFGVIEGDCGVLDDEEWLAGSTSFIFQTTLDFGTDEYDDGDKEKLSPGAQEVLTEGGLNSGSLLSEAFASELLERCELARLLKTEKEIDYANPDGDKTDLLTRIDERIIGVSVTRAHPLDAAFDQGHDAALERAVALLDKKLVNVLDATANVTGDDVWERQILYVIASDQTRVDAMLEGLTQIEADSPDLLSGTIVFIARTDGADDPLYCAPSPCP